VPGLVVRRVLEPCETERTRLGRELVAREAEQRAAQRARSERLERQDAAQAPDAGAAQQPQQQRLDLVIRVMRREQPFAGPQ
jgi:hypothetical protein